MIDTHTLLASAEFHSMTHIPFLDTTVLTNEVGAIELFNTLFKLAITIGAMLAVGFFIFGGLQMILARDKAEKVTKGKEKMTNAVIGLLMLISIYVVLNTINPQITSLTLLQDPNGGNIPTLQTKPQQRQMNLVEQGQQTLKKLGEETNYDFSKLTSEADKDKFCTAVYNASGGGVMLEPAGSNGYCKNVWAPKQRLQQLSQQQHTFYCRKDSKITSCDTGYYVSKQECERRENNACDTQNHCELPQSSVPKPEISLQNGHLIVTEAVSAQLV